MNSKDTLAGTSTTPTSPGPAGGPEPVAYAGPAVSTHRVRRNVPLLRRGWFVKLMIALSVLVVLGAIFSVYRKWGSVRLPTSYILLYGDDTTADAEVTVLAGGDVVARVTLRESDHYTAPVMVEPGPYTIEARKDGQLVLVHRFDLPGQARGVLLPISLRPEAYAEGSYPMRVLRPGTRPSSRPG